MQDRRRILQKELKLKNLILEYFIPSKELDSLQEKAFWSEERDEWMLPNLQYSGNSLRNNEEYKQPPREANEYEELTKLELDSHPNMYFVYTEEGMMRQMDLNPNDKKAKPKKGKSSSKRPASKRKQLS